jgi:hypothetical protein
VAGVASAVAGTSTALSMVVPTTAAWYPLRMHARLQRSTHSLTTRQTNRKWDIP